MLFRSDWFKCNILPLTKNDCIFVDNNKGKDSYIDMYLMSLCKINIIANSSFSWWGAYLNKNKHNMVIAPKKWHNEQLFNTQQMPSWFLI